ncbi:MAG: hypothetical protein ABEI31_05865 [Halodesulfurarchaeum sp.]
MTEYYDLVLGLIPVVLLGFGGGLQFAGLAQTTAITVGGLVAVGVVGHALFVNGPVALGGTVESEPTTGPINTAE